MNIPKHASEQWRVIEHNDGTLSVVDRRGENACRKDNADLISAAPEMLSALRNLVDDWERAVGRPIPEDHEAKAAIAKAEGRQ